MVRVQRVVTGAHSRSKASSGSQGAQPGHGAPNDAQSASGLRALCLAKAYAMLLPFTTGVSVAETPQSDEEEPSSTDEEEPSKAAEALAEAHASRAVLCALSRGPYLTPFSLASMF